MGPSSSVIPPWFLNPSKEGPEFGKTDGPSVACLESAREGLWNSKMTSNFATRYKKDLSTEALKTKLVRRKSISQKESRHKRFNKGRQFGLADVNTQHARDKELSRLEEMSEAHSPDKSHGKPKQIPNAKICGKERMEMLQRYKAEKELRKLKEQREKPVFKCGRYKPEMPSFLPPSSQIPVLSKPREKASALPVRVTRSKAKSVLEEVANPPARSQASTMVPKCTRKDGGLQPPQPRQQPIYVDKPAKKESKGPQSAIPPPTHGRVTRATAAAMSRIPQVFKPAATAGNQMQRRVARKGKQQTETRNAEVLRDTKEDVTMEPVEERADFQPALAEEAEVFPEKENMPISFVPALSPRRTRSFAPQNFVFKPLEGMASFKVTPMTPSRANVFLSPDLTWSPTKTTSEAPKEDAKEPAPLDRRLERGSSPAAEIIKEDLPECRSAVESQEEETERTSDETTMAIPCETKQLASLPASEALDPTGEPQHDVPYFRNILHCETERLSSCCLDWDGTAETDIPEDAKDLVRTTVGQTRLLVAERFKQFEGLVDNCEFRRGEKETTCSDLDGFWDMIAFQVEDVNKKFERLRKLQENGWQAAEGNQTKPITKKKSACQRVARASHGSAGRTAARKRLAAIKEMMKNKTKPEEAAADSAGQATPQEKEEKITFDGGFFRVESPARLFLGQTPKSANRSSRRASRRATPRSASRRSLRSCVDNLVTRLATPAAHRSCPPSPDPDAVTGLPQTYFLSHISDESDTQAAEGSSAAVDGTAGEADETQRATTDGTPRSSDTNDLDSADSRATESPETENNDSDVAEEVQQTTMELGEDGVMQSPEKDALVEGASSQSEEQHTPEQQTGPLLAGFSCNSATPEGKPNLNCSLFFTPLKNEAQKFAAAASDNDLIVFSPLPFPAGEK
ncbi:disks large-associated protein 5 [Heteronotia binoei]|uniref:disks large-associated protein 5 n=1 Tax=Heteronotia binoei TaxID=13085 RepID=UPI00292EADDF|nr:disks large-associated protein 5 [Heteronotia binoei]